MDCVDCQDMLAEYALDSLAPRDTEKVAEHLATGCTVCQQYLDGVHEAWAALADTLEPAIPPAHLKSDLLARLNSESAPSRARQRYILSSELKAVTVSHHGRTLISACPWHTILPYLAATFCGIALGFLFARSSTFDSKLVARYHSQLQQAERTFGPHQMRFAALHMTGNSPEIYGYLIWDSVAEELHVYLFDLGPPVGGSVYRLWLVADDDAWVPVGDLNVGPDGVCSAVIDIPKPAKPVSRVVVTTEPSDGTNSDNEAHGPIGLRGEFL